MTGPEAGFLLLTCRLGNPDRKVLSTAQLRTLSQRMKDFHMDDSDRDLTAADLTALGYGREMSDRIIALLNEQEFLIHYLRRAQRAGCTPIPRISPLYPQVLRNQLGNDAPGCLWARGDLDMLNTPMISLVGSRDLCPQNAEFAREAGCQTAIQGYTLVSGNARGADKTAQEACLASGGRVISIVADSLGKHPLRENVLYLSEDGFDEEFSPSRALSRNRCIHAMGEKTLVVQCGYQQGGTWDGTVKNLRFGWSPVFCLDDGSPAAQLLCQMGATLVNVDDLADFDQLKNSQDNLFDR